MIPFLDSAREVRFLKPRLFRALGRVLKRSRFILDAEVSAFEREFAAYLGIPHAVGVANGTDALALALRATGLQPGSLVIVPPNSAVPTAAAVLLAGGRPLFLDVEPDRLTLSPDRLEEYLSTRCRRGPGGILRDKKSGWRVQAVVPVHLYGRPARMRRILAIARAHRLIVVEDAAQAVGASLDGRKLGTFGDAAAFSFYPTKNLGALGDGGAVATRSATVAAALKRLRMYGFDGGYRLREAGINSRLDEIQAALLREKLPLLNGWNAARRRLAAQYQRGMKGLPIGLPQDPEGSCHHLFVIRAKRREDLRRRLAAEGVGTLVHYPVPIHRLKPYADPRLQGGSLAEAEKACREVISLPLNPFVTAGERDAVVRALRRCLPG